MASFVRPFNPSSVARVSPDLVVRLPDPARVSGDPLVRNGVARYAGATMVMLQVAPSGASFVLSSPVTGPVRLVDLNKQSPVPADDTGVDTLIAASITRLLEISPLPFGQDSTLGHFKQGLPTFYLGCSSSLVLPPPAGDDLLTTSQALSNVLAGTQVCVGVLFQDRLALSPWTWIDVIRAAMQAAGDTSGANTWNTLASLYANVTGLCVRDHAGRPAANQTFQVRIRQTGGTFEGPWTLTTGADGDLEQAAVANPLSRAGGPQASLFGTAGEQTELKWSGDAPLADAPLQVHSLYETGQSTSPLTPILLPADTTRGHLQLLDLSRWYTPPPAGSSLPRFRTNSRVEPLVDGVLTLKMLAGDLKACAGQGRGAHLAGWGFADFALVPGDDTTKLSALTDAIITGGGGARFLMYKFVNWKQDPDIWARTAAGVGLLIVSSAIVFASALGATDTNAVGYSVVLGGLILGEALLPKVFSASEMIDKKMERNTGILTALNAKQSHIALWSIHPSTMADNPLAPTTLPFGLHDYIDQFGAWHQKIQLVKRSPDAQGNEYAAYVGGIDIASNRLDTPGHQLQSPFHDVHARITGPGAADVFKTWDERYAYDRQAVSGSLAPAFSAPAATALAGQAAKHITQIGRTYYKAKTGSTSPLTFASQGEKTTHDTLMRAIKAAREYIYIEDQYFTPNDSQPPPPIVDTFFDALLAAETHCQRLLIVVPAETDQPFGDLRRRHLFGRLVTAWGSRALIGSPLRRPLLSNPGRIASEGRCVLMGPLSPTSTLVTLGPKARVPKTAPFWLWIDGELMLTSGLPKETTVDGTLCMEVSVLRGPAGTNARWGAKARNHKKGAAVTLSQLKGIYVHSKLMIVDDVFVSIGSTNMNRRGLFHDGEINVFAIPEQLKAAPDNPARALRTALWAEQLGLPPAQGPALLGDPIAAFELFRRARAQGNRFTPFAALDLKPYLSIATTDGVVMLALKAAISGFTATQLKMLWNTVSDPTSDLDPDPTAGPTP